jgi:hypothetical protein
MSEEKDSAQMEAEMEELKKQGGSAEAEESFIDPQINPTEGIGERKAVERRKDRVMQILHTLPEKAQTAILESLTEEDMQRYGVSKDQDRTELIEITRDNPPEDADPFGYQAMQEAQSESMVEGSPAGEGEGEGENAGSGDPNADAEARRAPPDPPESDEPLVGVPVDEYAGGTVVLPQAGEHTKSDDEKAGADGADPEDKDDDGDGDEQSDDGHDQQSDQDRSDDQDTQVHQQPGQQEQDDDPSTEQIPVAGDSDQGSQSQSSRGDERGGWAGSNGSGSNGSGSNGSESNGSGSSDAQGGSDEASSSSGSQREEGGLRRLFRRSGS